ncbi:MAG: lipocalin family protein [Pseudomonadota bacterium]
MFSGCTSSAQQSPLPVTEDLDLPRFMGKWYVIANIPTVFERDAYAATEEYRWLGEQKVATTFRYRKGSLDAEWREMNPTAFVDEQRPGVWKMQFVWPFKADYRVMYVDDAYTVAIVGREKRDYVWLMARSPQMDAAALDASIERIAQAGYDITQLRMIPHPGAPEVAAQ